MKKIMYSLAVLCISFFSLTVSAQWITYGSNVYTNGYVGIGTTPTGYKLDVNGQIRSRNDLYIEKAGGVGGTLVLVNPDKIESGSGREWRIINYGGISNGNSLQFVVYDRFGCTGGLCTNRFTIMDNGNVGIGYTHPSYMLDVAGRIRSTGNLIVSDERLKSNIQFLSTEKSKLYQLNARSYDKVLSIAEEPENPDETIFEYGFLAQEVQSIFPELVSEDENGILSVNYTALIPIIVDALREEHTKVEVLENIVAEQQKQINQLLALTNDDVTSAKSIKAEAYPYLEQNIPNPFNQSTQIHYYVPETVQTAYLCIYDLQGKQLKQIKLTARGEGVETITASQFTAGMYIYTLIADGKEIDTKRMILTD